MVYRAVGKNCPYCQFPIKKESEVKWCPVCKMPHHIDCWKENKGCTTFACPGVINIDRFDGLESNSFGATEDQERWYLWRKGIVHGPLPREQLNDQYGIKPDDWICSNYKNWIEGSQFIRSLSTSNNYNFDKFIVNKNKTTKSLIVGIVLVLALAIILIYNNQLATKSAEEYALNIQAVKMEMISSGADAEKIMNLTQKVWLNVIFKTADFETDQYTRKGVVWVDDFNVALSNLYQDVTIKKDIREIESSQKRVTELMKLLQDPPPEYERSYETLIDLYAAYRSLTELAINPKGSLNTYSENKSKRIDEFLLFYRRLETQLPD